MEHTSPDASAGACPDLKEIVDPLRLRRERERWPGIDRVPAHSRIVVLDHGGRTRPIIHRGSLHLRSRLVSNSTGLLQITEGNALPFLCRMWEIDGLNADWQAHPYLIQTAAGTGVLSWYPDGVFVRHGSRPVVVEAKRTIRDIEDPDYLLKMKTMAKLLASIGWGMQILYEEDIFGPKHVREIRAANVTSIYDRRFMARSQHEAWVVDDLVARGKPIAWGDAGALIAPTDPLQGDAVLENAVANRRFIVDLDRRRTPRTILTPVAPAAPAATIRI